MSNKTKTPFWKSHNVMMAIMLAAAIGLMFFLPARSSGTSWLSYLFLLLCPLMHLFMMGGHGGHGDHDAQKPLVKADENEPHRHKS